MPVVALLVAFIVYAGPLDGQNFGTVCVQMCEDPSQCPQTTDACRSSDPQLRGLTDFATAAAGLLVSNALSGGSREQLWIATVPAGATAALVAGLSLVVDQMLAVMRRLGNEAFAQVEAGKIPVFEIPWAIEGSAWVTLEGFGRIGSGFPRQTGIWSLE